MYGLIKQCQLCVCVTFRAFVLGALLVAGFSVSPDALAGQSSQQKFADAFTPHRALYQMELLSARQGASVSGARGTMFYRFEPLCAGWEVETRVSMSLTHDSLEMADVMKTAWSFSSFESYNGRELTFSVDHLQNGQQVEVFTGTANKEVNGGSAFFDGEDVMDVSLPKGALFPAEHLRQLLEKAKNGEKTDHSIVFDGASIDNPYRINTVVLGQVVASNDGHSTLASSDNPTATPSISGTPASFNVVAASKVPTSPVWRVRMAYFPYYDDGGVPEFELEVDFREDGVAQQMVQDFGDFTLRLTPTLIEVLPETPCK